MTLLLVLTAWTFSLALVTALCAAARLGDRDQRRREAVAIEWDTADQPAIAARNVRAAEPTESGVLAAAGSLAA